MNKAAAARIATERDNSKKNAAEKRRASRRAIALREQTAHENERASRKATYVLEDHAPGTPPSRKSTRKASNRIKESSPLDIREEAVRTAPKERAVRQRVKNVRVRAH